MPDNSVSLSHEEQTYFDTSGEQAPAPSGEQQAPAEPAKQPVAKKATTKGKATAEAVPEAETESEVTAQEPAKKSAEQEELANLKAALREERQGRKEFESKATQRLQALQDAMLARQQAAQPQAIQQKTQEIPDPEKDPMGALKALLAQARENKQAVEQAQTITTQEMQRRQNEQRIMGEASRMEMEYLREQPDYDATTGQSPGYNEASAFLVNMRRAELQAVGTYNPVQINQLIAQEAIGLAQQALNAGRNPAQVVMDVAKARGFAPKPKAAAPAETEQQRLARIAKGQEAGFSLSQAGGSKSPSAGKGLDAKTLANMSDEDFTAFVEKAKKSELRGVMGD